MIKLLDFMRKHKILTIMLSILIFVVPLVVVHIIYKMDCKITWLQSEWTSGDLLAYIAGFEAFIGTVSLGFLALWQNHQTQMQYLESQEPLLSMELIEEDSILYLAMENTGGVEAKDIKIKVSNILNNGENNRLDLDGLFDMVFELYPKEKVKGRLAYSGENIATEIFPQISIKVSYTRPDLKRKKEYERTVIYNSGHLPNMNVSSNTKYDSIASDVDKIARANVRIANYLDGRQVTKLDEINILAGRSLKNDIADIMKSVEKTPILSRTETIKESFGVQSEERENG